MNVQISVFFFTQEWDVDSSSQHDWIISESSSNRDAQKDYKSCKMILHSLITYKILDCYLGQIVITLGKFLCSGINKGFSYLLNLEQLVCSQYLELLLLNQKYSEHHPIMTHEIAFALYSGYFSFPIKFILPALLSFLLVEVKGVCCLGKACRTNTTSETRNTR